MEQLTVTIEVSDQIDRINHERNAGDNQACKVLA